VQKARTECSVERLFPNDFHEHAFAAVAVEFSVEDLFPGAEIELAFGDGDDDFAAEDLAFEMGVGVVFASVIVAVLIDWRVRREFLEPDFPIVHEAGFVVVDENRRANVHGVHEHEPFLHAAFADERGDVWRDVHETPARWDLHPEIVSQRFHVGLIAQERLRDNVLE
jgi:hypothetical protein